MAFRIVVNREECARSRVVAGLSIRQAATALDVSHAHLGYIEAGKRYPSAPLIKRMAQLYGVATDALVAGVVDGDAA